MTQVQDWLEDASIFLGIAESGQDVGMNAETAKSCLDCVLESEESTEEEKAEAKEMMHSVIDLLGEVQYCHQDEITKELEYEGGIDTFEEWEDEDLLTGR